MKGHKKLVSLVMAVMFCITFLAPVLVAPEAAMASSTYTVLKSQTIGDLNASDPINNVVVQLDVANVASVAANDRVTFHLPSDVEMKQYYGPGGGDGVNAAAPMVAIYYQGAAATANWSGIYTVVNGVPTDCAATAPATTYGGVEVTAPLLIDNNANVPNQFATNCAAAAPRYVAYPIGTSTFEIKIVNWTAGTSGVGRLMIYMNQVWLTGAVDGDLTANIFAPSTSAFSGGSFVFAKYQTGGKGTMSGAKSVVSMANESKTLDTIMMQETVKNSIATSEEIRFKLPNGFIWDYAVTGTNTPQVVGSWAFTQYGTAQWAYDITGDGGRTMKITPKPTMGGKTSEGRILIGNIRVKVDDEAVAKKGEVQVTVSSDKGNVTAQTFTVANYKDYSVEVAEVSTKEVIAGQSDTELGSFKIKEGLAGSLLAGRTISLTLPVGVKWDFNYGNTPGVAGNPMYTLLNDGTNVTTGATFSSYDSTKRVIKFTVPDGWNTAPAKKTDTTFKNLKTIIDPSFTGDVVVEVGGTAGVTGKAKVATVLAPATATVDKTPDLIIGAQAQAIGTMLIKESKKEALKATGSTITLTLPNNSTWASKGTVTVSEGDLSIDKVTTANGVMTITLKGSSSVPSTIKIEGATVTPDRTVPEGDYKVDIAGNGVYDATVAGYFNVTKMASVVIGKIVTPAPTQTITNAGANGSFTVGQQFMIVNGQYKTLEVAPYIKDSRTYVPVRALGDALGATTAWDAATQKVTITKGTKTVELVIGSKTAKVNGADQALDVAPEITGGRTMLPARVVCEGLGYAVTFDAASKQIIFSSAM